MHGPALTACLLASGLMLGTALPWTGAAQAQSVTLRLATDSGARGSAPGDAIERWAALIEEASGGDIEVDVFFQNELGGQQEVFDLFVANEVQLMLNWPMTSYDPRIAVLYTPYMVASWDEALEAYRPGGWVNGMLGDIYNDIGLEFFGAWPEGFNGVATRGSYALSVEDASALRIRVPPVFPMAETIQAMGYQTATIDWGEVFTAIQTGVVDGDGANVIYWDYEYFRDTLDYYTRTRQQFLTGILSMNLEAWEGLDEAQQTIVRDAAVTVMEEGFANAQGLDEGYVQQAIEAGMEYIDPTTEQLAPIATAVRDTVWPMLEEQVGTEIMDVIRANATEF
ncbi:TRAP transporter substrate-binding protein DctP [Pararhodobacter sp. CCB-MM2]|uniref:TRAP transporter substrate-binding protein DctP n=1 Tax=Pararhodobacter sp. CCB-MM2 TaxID=1786003 RepID=UPI0008356F61|nr:TRAP transporter substrate-binding protein DctP [Pararhodobacter sp. CCB-MM2]